MAGNERAVTVRWLKGLEFEGTAPGRAATTLVDGDSRAALSPVELLLVAAATCAGADVVSILLKMRVELRSLEIVMQGTRRAEDPRRYTAIHYQFNVAGAGADETKARRAISLSLEKYCSVAASLAPDMQISYDVAIR